ncbi:hypothetical protein DPMN_012264 [Dreissena polymorpha]|uniref:Uncharacterized protein n=1 Tax=Dreissena polymorpha TaxID=45954 RepID=A0A9D4N5H6_DREPO|nr:hypothetical protein DPMN_012264 [Dreissena polymorpha]
MTETGSRGIKSRTLRKTTESIDFALSQVNSKVSELEKQRNNLQDEIVYSQSQSMKNNLVFSCIPETRTGTFEDAEITLWTFLQE